MKWTDWPIRPLAMVIFMIYQPERKKKSRRTRHKNLESRCIERTERIDGKNRKTKQNFSRGCMPKYHHLRIWMHQGYTRACVTHFSRHSIIAKSICSSVNIRQLTMMNLRCDVTKLSSCPENVKWLRRGKKHSPAFLLLREMAGWNKPRDTTFFLSLGVSIFLEKKFGFIFISFSFDEGNNNENRLHSQDIT
jgi:hypothetical protein